MTTTVMPSAFDSAHELAAAYKERASAPKPPPFYDERIDREQMQESVVLAHLRDLSRRGQALYLLVTPDTIETQIDPVSAAVLTAAQRYQVGEQAINSPRLDQIFATARQSLQELVQDTVSIVATRR